MVNCWDDNYYQKHERQLLGRCREKRRPHTPLVEMEVSAATMESSVGDLIFKIIKDSHRIQKSQ